MSPPVTGLAKLGLRPGRAAATKDVFAELRSHPCHSSYLDAVITRIDSNSAHELDELLLAWSKGARARGAG